MLGGPTTVPLGDIADMFDIQIIKGFGGADVAVAAYPEYGNEWFALVCDDIPQQIFHVSEGVPKTVAAVYDGSGADHSVGVFPLGDWDSDADIDVTISQVDFLSDKGAALQIDFDPVMQIEEAYGDSGQLSSYNLSGIARFSTSRPGLLSTQAKVAVTLTNAAGTYTLTLSVGGTPIASGSRVGNGLITLTALNNSGVSGTIVVAYTADVTSGCFLIGRWAHHYDVVCGAQTGTVYDAGRGTRLSITFSGLTPGSNSVNITPVSDTGINGSSLATASNVPGRPQPAGALAYVSGNATNSVISVVRSTTIGVTYGLFDVENIGGPLKLSEVADVKPTQVADFTWALPAKSMDTGLRRIVVAAFNGAIEDGTRNELVLEYLAGVIVQPRPNTPGFSLTLPQPVTGGRTISVDWTYDTASEQGVAVKIWLYLLAEGAAIPADGAAGNVSVLLSSLTPINGIYRGALTAVAPADGWYRVLVRAEAVSQSANVNATTDPVLASNSVMAQVGNVAFTVRA